MYGDQNRPSGYVDKLFDMSIQYKNKSIKNDSVIPRKSFSLADFSRLFFSSIPPGQVQPNLMEHGTKFLS